MDKVNISEKLSQFNDYYNPRIIGELNGQDVKAVKLMGEFVWHHHDNEDELFLVLKGHLRIEMEDGAVELDEGEMFVVPKGVLHNPVAAQECHVLLVERKSTRHTGDVVTAKTRSVADQLRPL